MIYDQLAAKKTYLWWPKKGLNLRKKDQRLVWFDRKLCCLDQFS